MIIPVRCFTCGKVTGNKWLKYEFLIKQGKTADEALKEIDMVRYCCRRIFLTHVETIDTLLKYKQLPQVAENKS